jgi:hypothetical protein
VLADVRRDLALALTGRAQDLEDRSRLYRLADELVKRHETSARRLVDAFGAAGVEAAVLMLMMWVTRSPFEIREAAELLGVDVVRAREVLIGLRRAGFVELVALTTFGALP